MGCQVYKFICCVLSQTLYLSILSSSCASERDLRSGHPCYDHRTGTFRDLDVYQLLFRMQTHTKSMEARNTGYLLWGAIHSIQYRDLSTYVCYPLRVKPVDDTQLWLANVITIKVASITFDIVLLIIPVSLFWKFRVGSRVKLALFLICEVGVMWVALLIVHRSQLTS